MRVAKNSSGKFFCGSIHEPLALSRFAGLTSVSDSISVAWISAQAVLADRDPGQALLSWETAVRAECFENGLPSDFRDKKTSELNHFGRVCHPKAAGPLVDWIVGDHSFFS